MKINTDFHLQPVLIVSQKQKYKQYFWFRSRKSYTCNKHREVFVLHCTLYTVLSYLQHPPVHHKCMNINAQNPSHVTY